MNRDINMAGSTTTEYLQNPESIASSLRLKVDEYVKALDPLRALGYIENSRTVTNGDNSNNRSTDNIGSIQNIEIGLVLGNFAAYSELGNLTSKLVHENQALEQRLVAIGVVLHLLRDDRPALRNYILENSSERTYLGIFFDENEKWCPSPDAAAVLASPLSGMLQVLCQISRLEMKLGTAVPSALLEEIEVNLDHCIKRLPPDSILPVRIMALKREVRQIPEILCLDETATSSASRLNNSYGSRLSALSKGLRLEASGHFDSASRIFESIDNLSLFRKEFQATVLKSRFRSRAVVGLPLADIFQDEESAIQGQHGNGVLTRVDLEKTLLECIELLPADLSSVVQATSVASQAIRVEGHQSRIAALYRLRGLAISYECGAPIQCVEILRALTSQIDLGHEVVNFAERMLVSEIIEGLLQLEIVAADEVDELKAFWTLTASSRSQPSRFFLSNELHRGLVESNGSRLKLSSNDYLPESLSVDGLVESRIRLVDALNEVALSASEDSYAHFKDVVDKIPARIFAVFGCYYDKVWEIFEQRHDERIALSAMRRAIDVSQEGLGLQSIRMAVELAERYEIAFEYRSAAESYDKLLAEGVYWVHGGSLLEQSVLVRAGRAWAMNFDHGKAQLCFERALAVLQGTLKLEEEFDILELMAISCSHSEMPLKAIEYSRRAASLVEAADLQSARRIWTSLFRSAQIAETMGDTNRAIADVEHATHALEKFAGEADEDLILSRSRLYFLTLEKSSQDVAHSTFINNKHTFDSPS